MANASLLLVLLFAAASLPAQLTSHSNLTMPAMPAGSAGCPISFGAQVDSRAVARWTQNPAQKDPGRDLQLTFKPVDTAQILGASVIVHGLSGHERLLLVSDRSLDDRTQSFDLERVSGRASLDQTNVLVTKMMSVEWAEVTELKYADGSVWHPSQSSQCQATPNRFQPVDASAH